MHSPSNNTLIVSFIKLGHPDYAQTGPHIFRTYMCCVLILKTCFKVLLLSLPYIALEVAQSLPDNDWISALKGACL